MIRCSLLLYALILAQDTMTSNVYLTIICHYNPYQFSVGPSQHPDGTMSSNILHRKVIRIGGNFTEDMEIRIP